MVQNDIYTLGIDIGSTTVKIAVLDQDNEVLFSDYERHFANIQETLSDLLGRAIHKLGAIHVSPVITGSGGLTLAKHLGVPFVQEVIAVSTALQDYAPQTDVAIELGGEDAKITYFGSAPEQRAARPAAAQAPGQYRYPGAVAAADCGAGGCHLRCARCALQNLYGGAGRQISGRHAAVAGVCTRARQRPLGAVRAARRIYGGPVAAAFLNY